MIARIPLLAEELGDGNGDLVEVACSQLQKEGRRIFRLEAVDSGIHIRAQREKGQPADLQPVFVLQTGRG